MSLRAPSRIRRSRWAVASAGTTLTLALALAGCGSSAERAEGSPRTSPATSAGGAYPVTVSNCGTSTTYTKAPTRAVSNDINTTEDMIALGLGPRMVGTFGVSGDASSDKTMPQRYATALRQIHAASPKYITLEPLVGLSPDFLFAGWNYGLENGTPLTPTGLSTYGIKTLALTESCANVQSGTSAVGIDGTYQDLDNLGRIFDVLPKAQQLVASMKAEVAAAQAKTGGLAPIRVFNYDSGDAAPFTAGGLATPNGLISLGGGTNIFSGLKKSWTTVSWEQVKAADPQCILINDYGTPTAAQKKKFLQTNPITKDLTAVKNGCFLTLSYDQVTPGPRNAEAVTSIARWLHPAAYGLPADGS